MRWLPLLLTACGVVGGPGKDPADTDTPAEDSAPGGGGPSDPADVTWHRDLRPIVERSCLVGCHEAGGIGPFSLEDDPAEWARGRPAWAPLVVDAVTTGAMPPWHASDDCHPIVGSRRLPSEEIARFAAWRAGGFELGSPADFVAPAAPDAVVLPTPDRLLGFEAPYTPNPARPDDYRCLPLGDVLDADLFVRALEVLPDATEVVHHAILFEVGASAVGEVAQRDAAEAGPGYTCFGAPVSGADFFDSDVIHNVFTYAPGRGAEVLAPGEARRIPAGSRLVLQVHYNTLGMEPAKVPADATRLALWELDGEPSALLRTVGLPHLGLDVPAGDPASVETQTFPIGARLEVVGILGHMHQLGTSLKVEVLRKDGGTECALDLPAWDFAWQQGYDFPRDQPLVVQPGDQVRLTCTYDNSAANQPVVNGVQLEPRRVRWGESTRDEMCLTYPVLREPVAGGPAACDAFEACFTTCPEGDGVCLGDCLEDAADACTLCAVPKLSTCADPSCLAPLATLGACLKGCGGGQLGCIVGACRTQTEAYLACQDPFVRDGDCDAALASCGVTW